MLLKVVVYIAAGCGGLCRDSAGRWLCGFSRNIGSCNAFIAEIWGVLEGLRLAQSRGFSHLELQIDSATVADNLKGKGSKNALGGRLIDKVLLCLQVGFELTTYTERITDALMF